LLPGWRRFHTNLLLFSSQPGFQLSCKLRSACILSGRSTVETPCFHCYSQTVALFVSASTCLPSLCLETGLAYPPLSRSFHGNGCFSVSPVIGLSKYATIFSGAALSVSNRGRLISQQPVVFNISHCLRCIWYIRRFGSWLFCCLRRTGCDYTDRYIFYYYILFLC
jgi:hypothetical protein